MARAFQVDILLAGLRDTNNNILSGGKVYTYEAGTTTNKETWLDSNKNTPATNPIILDSNGMAQVYADGAYKFIVKDSNDVTLYTWDNLYFSQDKDLSNNTYLKGENNAGTGTIDILKIGSDDLLHLSVGAGTVLDSSSSNLKITTNTPDNSDDKRLYISSGGDASSTRGAFLDISGNENSNAGTAILASGDISGAKSILQGSGTNGSSEIRTNGIVRFNIDSAGLVTGDIFDWKDWTPTYGASGSMTWTSITTEHAKYIQLGQLVIFSIRAIGTTGGTADAELNFTAPITPMAGQQTAGGAQVVENGGRNVGIWYQFTDGSDLFRVAKGGGVNWTLASNTGFGVTGFYLAN